MNTATRSTRRQIITGVFLVLALIGGLMRWLAPESSTAHDLGTLLMVLWLPIVGNIIGWLMQRARQIQPSPPGFAPGAAFEPHVRIEFTLLAPDTPRMARPIRAGYFVGALAVDSEAFTTRLAVPPDGEPQPEQACTLQVQFLRPELALSRLTPGTRFVLLSGRRALGSGRVLEG